MKFRRILCSNGIQDPLKPQVYRFWTVNPICHLKPHHAMRVEKKVTSSLPMTITIILWPTDRPYDKNVFGVCQFDTLSEFNVQYPKKWNQPHVLLEGGKGIRSRLLHESVCSCSSSLPLSWHFCRSCRRRSVVIAGLISRFTKIGPRNNIRSHVVPLTDIPVQSNRSGVVDSSVHVKVLTWVCILRIDRPRAQ